MLSITRIFTQHINPGPKVANRAVSTAISCDTVSFSSGVKIKNPFERLTQWWKNFLISLRNKRLFENTNSWDEAHLTRFIESHFSDEYKIAQKRGLFKTDLFHPERRLDTDAIEALVELSDERFLNFQKRNLYSFVIPHNGNWRVCDVRCLARLSDEDFANIAKRGLNSAESPLKTYIRDPYDMAELAELSDREFANIRERKLLNPELYKNMWGKLTGTDIAMLAKLPDKIFANIQKRNLTSAKYYGFNENFDIWQISELAKMSDEAFLNIEKRGLMNRDFALEYGINSGRDIKTMAELSEEKFEFAKGFLKKCHWKQYPIVVGRILRELPLEKIRKLQARCTNEEIVELFSGEKGMNFLRRKLGIVKLLSKGKIDMQTVKSLAETINYGGKRISREIISDLKMLKQKKSVVSEFLPGTSLEDAFKLSGAGDVVQIGEKMFINDGEKLSHWQMDRKTFDKLFPPVKRFMIKQKSGDCYLLAGISDCMRNPITRAEIYKSFKTDGDDVICTIKAYKDFNGAVRFEKGKLPWGFEYAEACDGVKMLEYTYAKTSLRYTSVDLPPYLNAEISPYNLSQRMMGGEASDAYHELLGAKRLDYIIKMPKINKKTGVNEVECLIGTQHEVLPLPKKFALHRVRFYSEKEWQKILEQYANRDDYLLSFSTFIGANDRRYDIIESHVYSIVSYDSLKKTVKMVNPHNTAALIELPLSKLSEYSCKLNIAKIK